MSKSRHAKSLYGGLGSGWGQSTAGSGVSPSPHADEDELAAAAAAGLLAVAFEPLLHAVTLWLPLQEEQMCVYLHTCLWHPRESLKW